jgi:hypothetical protein
VFLVISIIAAAGIVLCAPRLRKAYVAKS